MYVMCLGKGKPFEHGWKKKIPAATAVARKIHLFIPYGAGEGASAQHVTK